MIVVNETRTRRAIVVELQRYKSYWQIVLGRKVYLRFEANEIQVIASIPGSIFAADRYAIKQFNFDYFNLQEKKEAWQKIQMIELWLSELTPKQKEAIFYRIMDHDFELNENEFSDLSLKWKTLSYGEIAQRMHVSKSTVFDYVHTALEKIEKIA